MEKKDNTRFLITVWIITALWAGIIFYFSSQPQSESDSASSAALGILNSLFFNGDLNQSSSIKILGRELDITFIIRKSAHFLEYAVLSILLYSGFSEVTRKSTRRVLTFLCFFLYACADEYHQRFVAGRSCEIRDILIDCAGGLAGLLIACIFSKAKTLFQDIIHSNKY